MEKIKVTYIGPAREVLIPRAGKEPFQRNVEREIPRSLALGLNSETWKLPEDVVKASNPSQEAAGDAGKKKSTKITPKK